MTCRCLAVGLVAIFAAGCGDNSPLCDGCIVVDGVPAISNMTVDRDGRIVATVQGVGVRAIARMDRFGTLDPAFGDRGLAPTSRFFQPKAIVIQDSGAIRLGGAGDVEGGTVVYGFAADGHDDGLRIAGSGPLGQPIQYLMDQSGSLVASRARDKGFEGVLVRYGENGAQDASFGPVAVERAVAITADGAFVT